jgi:uncharacterized protein YqeY
MLREKLDQDLKEAMRSRDRIKLQTIRSVRAALLEKDIEFRGDESATVTDQTVIAVLQKQAKQRRDAISQYQTAGRDDLVKAESAELAIIESYLPQQLSEKEIRTTVASVVDRVGATSIKDMGRVMGPAMKELQGRADGSLVQKVVRELLNN